MANQLDMSTFQPLPAQTQTPSNQQAQPQSGGLDMSTFQPFGTEQPQPNMLDRALQFGGNIASGLGTGAMQTAGTIAAPVSRALHAVLPEGVAEALSPTVGVQAARAVGNAPLDTAGKKVGYAGEQMAEFLLGDEALKGLSLADRAGLLAQTAKLAEKHPVMAGLINGGLRSIRMGTVGAGQAAFHGGTPEEAGLTGLATGVTGMTLEGAAAAVDALKPVFETIAGEVVPVRATGPLAKTAELAEPARRALQKFDIAETQPAARGVIGAVASDIPSQGGAGLPAHAVDFSERAKQIQAQAQPVFDTLDKFTTGDTKTFSDWQNVERRAWAIKDFDAIDHARLAQEQIAQDAVNAGKLSADDLARARANWRQSVALETVDKALNRVSVVKPTPVQLLNKGEVDPGYIDGRAFRRTIRALQLPTQKYSEEGGVLKAAGFTPEHIRSLNELGQALEQGGGIHANYLLDKAWRLSKLAGELKAGSMAHGPVGAAGAVVATNVMARVLGKVMTDPAWARAIADGLLRSGLGPAAASVGAQAATHRYDETTGQAVPIQ